MSVFIINIQQFLFSESRYYVLPTSLFVLVGNTALHDCAESGNLQSLQLLLNHRAIMRKDEYGQSPIMSGANAAYKKVSSFTVLIY